MLVIAVGALCLLGVLSYTLVWHLNNVRHRLDKIRMPFTVSNIIFLRALEAGAKDEEWQRIMEEIDHGSADHGFRSYRQIMDLVAAGVSWEVAVVRVLLGDNVRVSDGETMHAKRVARERVGADR
jgi:hypothetical protein